jgi:hypothetical protein
VVGPVGQVDVEHDDVTAAALRECGLECLAEPEIPGMVEDPDPVDFSGELDGDCAGIVAAAVVDDEQFEPVCVAQRLEVTEQLEHVFAEDGGLVEGRQHDRDQRPCLPRVTHDLVHDEAAGRRGVDRRARRNSRGRGAGYHRGDSLPGPTRYGSELCPILARTPAAHDECHTSDETRVTPS